jgi:hypothetical protein
MRSWWLIGVGYRYIWPAEQLEVGFGDASVILIPPDIDRLVPTIAVAYQDDSHPEPLGGYRYRQDLGEPRRPDLTEAIRTARRFMSAATWWHRIPLEEVASSGTSGRPGPLSRPDGVPPVQTAPGIRWDGIRCMTSSDALIALALWREAAVSFVPSHRVLTYSRILEVGLPAGGGPEWTRRVEGLLPLLTDIEALAERERAADSGGRLAARLYDDFRCASAHAREDGRRYDPDEPADWAEFFEVAPLLRGLAEVLMEMELGLDRKSGCTRSGP